MKDEIMLLLGCGLTALLVTNACSSMYENESDDENDYDGRRGRRKSMRNRYDECEGYSNCSSSPMYSAPPAPATPEPFSVDYYGNAQTKPNEPSTYSPLMFGGMVTNEPYIESDYIEMSKYTDNPDQIKTYNEKNDSVGLPVTDMTDVSAGENNKYIYDRTIGTIGFTSTKIGGRFRGQADYIRGDIAVLPDKTGWFQVSSDPANKLMLGAMNVANGIGQPSSSSSASRAARAMDPSGKRKLKTLNSLRADAQKKANRPAGAQNALNNFQEPDDGPSVLDIMQAGYNQYKEDAKALGTAYTAGNPY